MSKPTDFDCLIIMEKCPRFERCSAPSCPLDLCQEERAVLEGEPRCTLGKKRRMEIGAGTALPLHGLRPREAASMARWEALPEVEKEARKARGKARLARFILDSGANDPSREQGHPEPGKGT